MDRNLDLLQTLKSMECPDATYEPEKSPLVFSKAKGSFVYDAEGKRYVDFCSGFGVMAFGHNPDYVAEICSEDSLLMHGMGDVYPSEAKIYLLEQIISLLPAHLDTGAFAVTGSQAVEYALKTAMQKTGKTGVIALTGGYHGLDFGALAVSERDDFRKPFKSWLNEDQVAFVEPESSPTEIDDAIKSLDERGYGVACIIAEPIQGRAGVRVLSPDFLSSLRSITRDRGIVLIFDEIFCGYGRTGCFSFSEQIDCDITCLGKPMGGGLPLSGFFARREVMNAWPESLGEAKHTGTFFGHALACRFGIAQLENLKEAERNKTVRKKEELIRSTASNLNALKSFSFNGKGLMLALNSTKPLFGVSLMNRCRENGLIVLASGTQAEGVSLIPAFNIPDDVLIEGLKILNRSVESLI